MPILNTIFTKDMVLDQEAFNQAVQRFNELSERMTTLQTKISDDLNNLRTGFDTPAGKKFFDVCGTKLLDPMRDQALIIQHVAENLKMAKTSYDSVFQEFSEVNNSIRNQK